jgi:hypothetical protein
MRNLYNILVVKGKRRQQLGDLILHAILQKQVYDDVNWFNGDQVQVRGSGLRDCF